MEVRIGMAGASGAGKTSLMTAMFLDMKRSLAACNDTRRSVSIMYASRATKEAMTDSMRRFSDCVRTGRFFAWERTARCGEFAFTIQFENGGMAKSFDFSIMDYPGGMLGDRRAFEEKCLPHIRKSDVLFVPIDAVALTAWFDAKAHDAATAKAMAERLETERILDVVGVWAREGDSSGAEKRLLYFVPVKTESFYADSRNCRNPRDGDIEKAVRELYSDRVGGVCENSRIAVELRPVDTYGCVALEKARWNRAEGVLEEEFRIEGGNMINPCGAVDLFSSVLRRRMANLEAVTRRDAEKSREAIEERGIFSRVWHLIFGDDEKQRLAGSEAAAELYRAGLEAIAGFSSGNRAAVLR